MPGDIDLKSRFVRASSYLKTLPKPANSDEAVAYLLGVLRTIAVPYGTEDTGHSGTTDTWPTRWISIEDLHNKRLYFQSDADLNMSWIDLNKLAASTEMLSIVPHPGLDKIQSETLTHIQWASAHRRLAPIRHCFKKFPLTPKTTHLVRSRVPIWKLDVVSLMYALIREGQKLGECTIENSCFFPWRGLSKESRAWIDLATGPKSGCRRD